MKVALNTDGAFTRTSDNSIEALIFDPSMNGEHGSWLLCSGGLGPNTSFHALANFDDLDDGLRELAGEDEFEVCVSNGLTFRRPGPVAAVNVLGSMGFIVCRSLYVHALVDGDSSMGAAEMKRVASERLFNTIATVQDIDYVGDPDRAWCFRARIAMEGVFHRDELAIMAKEAISGCDVDVTDVVDIEEVPFDTSSVGKVFTLSRTAA